MICNEMVIEHFISLSLSGQGGLALFVQLMPILILIIVSALSQMMVTQPPYSLSYRPYVVRHLERLVRCCENVSMFVSLSVILSSGQLDIFTKGIHQT